jgi:hypothetical protein
MRRYKSSRRSAGILGGMILAFALMGPSILPLTAIAQSRSVGDDAPLTDRERDLLERIQNLEKELAAFRDMQARLTAVEARLGEGRAREAYTYSPEDRQSAIGTAASNTTLRLADSLNVFDTGALANGVTVERVNYQLASASAGLKYRGFWLQGEGYFRKLDHFKADAPLPLSSVTNTGFYAQASHMIVPNRIELYGSTSCVLGDFTRHAHEFIVGGNYYPWDTRNLRLNLQVINVSHSPVSSTFGFYIGQITGKVVTLGFTAFYRVNS